MPLKFTPHKYQKIATRFGLENKYAGLFLDMGLGKTVITLTVIQELLDCFSIKKPLIVAPKSVAEHTWTAELKLWSHLAGFEISVIAGSPVDRMAAYYKPAHIYVISRDNLDWLINGFLKQFRKWPFDMIVLDESSSFKNRKSKRWKAVKKILPGVKRLLLLTGTPAPNGLMDLWAQMFLLDQGKRLSPYIETFREQYFHSIKKLQHGGYLYDINHGAEEKIFDKIKDICISMKSEDWLELPEKRDILKEVELDDYDEYHKFREEKILELPEGEITAFNASSLYTKLLQYANGAVYDSEKVYHTVHDKKLDVLEELIESLQGKPIIVFYCFQSDLDRIKKRIPGTTVYKNNKTIDAWNRGEIKVLLAHPASIGYGLNMQQGGNYMVWFGVLPNLELYLQGQKRIHRQGQKFTVFNYHILTKGTPELKVYKNLLRKDMTQNKLFYALKAD